MRDEPHALAPVVELIAGRLERKAEPRLRAEVEDDLMRRARSRAGDRTGKSGFDRAMEMPTEDSLDLGVAADDRGETGAVGQPGPIHPANSGRKGRMVHQHHSRPIRSFREDAIDPAQAVRA